MVNGAETAARKSSVRLKVDMPGHEGDAPDQTALLVKALRERPDALAVCPLDPATQETVIAQAGEHSHVFSLINETPGACCSMHIGMSAYTAGKRAADAAVEVLPPAGIILVCRSAHEDHDEAERTQGLLEQLTWIATTRGLSPTLYSPKQIAMDPAGVEELKRILSSTDPLVAVACTDNPMPLLDDLRSLRSRPASKLIVFGETPEIVQAIRTGDVYATIAFDPRDVGAAAVQCAAVFCRLGPLDQPRSGAGRINVPPRVVRRESLGAPGSWPP
jgi:ABC-type sugar transport system substrate-binding protein